MIEFVKHALVKSLMIELINIPYLRSIVERFEPIVVNDEKQRDRTNVLR